MSQCFRDADEGQSALAEIRSGAGPLEGQFWAVVALRSLVAQYLFIRPIANSTSQPPFLDRFSQKTLIGDSVGRTSQPRTQAMPALAHNAMATAVTFHLKLRRSGGERLINTLDTGLRR